MVRGLLRWKPSGPADSLHVAMFWGVGERPEDVIALYEKACAMLRIEIE